MQTMIEVPGAPSKEKSSMSKSTVVRFTVSAAILALVAGMGTGCEDTKPAAPVKAPDAAPAKAPEKAPEKK